MAGARFHVEAIWETLECRSVLIELGREAIKALQKKQMSQKESESEGVRKQTKEEVISWMGFVSKIVTIPSGWN